MSRNDGRTIDIVEDLCRFTTLRLSLKLNASLGGRTRADEYTSGLGVRGKRVNIELPELRACAYHH